MSNHLAPLLLLGLITGLPLPARPELGRSWTPVGGDWQWTREVMRMVRQGSETGTAVAFCKEVGGGNGAWRATVEPALGASEVGIWIRGAEGLDSGWLVTLSSADSDGFALKSADGKTLWRDRWAPWSPYHPYVLEGIIDGQRVRVQMFEWDGKTLISQSPWVEAPAGATQTDGMIGLYTREGIARYWGWERAQEPLSPIVEDAPNKRRLIQEEDSPWSIVGPGNWMWTSAKKERLRQYRPIERTSAIGREVRGVHRKWQARVKVDPGTGGAGMLFATNAEASQGFIAWLGGTWGAGSLMLYRLPTVGLWSGKQDNWHYDTEYLLRAETRPGQVRAELLAADGETLVQQTPWVDITEDESGREGCIGFMTWRGTGEFWGFSEGTMGVAGIRGLAPPPGTTAASALGASWIANGGGSWEWAGDDRTSLRQTGKPEQAVLLNTAVSGIMGTWSCRVRVPVGTEAAGLAFQARDEQGFACLLTGDGLKLEGLAGRTLWEDKRCHWERDTEYVLEGEVMVDRVAVRLLSADGATVISRCPDIYVAESNNHRTGHLGFLVRGGPAEFGQWQFK